MTRARLVKREQAIESERVDRTLTASVAASVAANTAREWMISHKEKSRPCAREAFAALFAGHRE